MCEQDGTIINREGLSYKACITMWLIASMCHFWGFIFHLGNWSSIHLVVFYYNKELGFVAQSFMSYYQQAPMFTKHNKALNEKLSLYRQSEVARHGKHWQCITLSQSDEKLGSKLLVHWSPKQGWCTSPDFTSINTAVQWLQS